MNSWFYKHVTVFLKFFYKNKYIQYFVTFKQSLIIFNLHEEIFCLIVDQYFVVIYLKIKLISIVPQIKHVVTQPRVIAPLKDFLEFFY